MGSTGGCGAIIDHSAASASSDLDTSHSPAVHARTHDRAHRRCVGVGRRHARRMLQPHTEALIDAFVSNFASAEAVGDADGRAASRRLGRLEQYCRSRCRAATLRVCRALRRAAVTRSFECQLPKGAVAHTRPPLQHAVHTHQHTMDAVVGTSAQSRANSAPNGSAFVCALCASTPAGTSNGPSEATPSSSPRSRRRWIRLAAARLLPFAERRAAPLLSRVAAGRVMRSAACGRCSGQAVPLVLKVMYLVLNEYGT